MIIPNIWENKSHVPVTTNQINVMKMNSSFRQHWEIRHGSQRASTSDVWLSEMCWSPLHRRVRAPKAIGLFQPCKHVFLKPVLVTTTEILSGVMVSEVSRRDGRTREHIPATTQLLHSYPGTLWSLPASCRTISVLRSTCVEGTASQQRCAIPNCFGKESKLGDNWFVQGICHSLRCQFGNHE